MADKEFTLRIITPERVFYEGIVDMVEFNTTEGQITEKDGEKEAALHSGFAEILPEGVTILAEIIEWPNEIDENRAEAALHRAEERLRSKTPETDIARAETALQRAMARIQVLR